MPRTLSRRPRRLAPAVLVATSLLLAGCGSRLSAEELRPAGAATVSLDQASRDALKSLASPAGPAAQKPSTTGGSAVQSDAPAATTPRASPRAGNASVTATGGAAAATGTSAGRTAATTAAPAAVATTARTCTGREAPISLGQVGTFSGVGGAITASARTALAVWAKAVNDRGGIACHPVTLTVIDDGMDPAKTSAAVATLVSKHRVVALVGTVAPATLNGLLDGVEKARIPVVGGDGVGREWNANRWLFPQGSSFEPVIEERLRYAVGMGKAKIGLLYCVEAGACTEVAEVAPKLAKQAGAEIVSSTPVSITQTDFTAQCQNAKNAGAQALLLGVDGSSIGRVARSCASLGYRPLLIANGLLISATQAADPGIRANQLLTTTANAPWLKTDTPGQREFAAAMGRYAPTAGLDAAAMVAWSAGKLFEAAIARLGAAAAGSVTTQDVLAGLGKIRGETLDGLAAPIAFSPGQEGAPVVGCAFVELLTTEGWTAPEGSKPVCAAKRRP
ncbi:MAG: ABC transporter substrate-binding protein [Sporichthyaceae bacterium]